MPLGNVEPFNLSIKKFNKATNAQIPLGKICIRNTALTPDGWKQCDAAGADGPFVVAVNELAATTDASFAGAQAPAEVIVEAGAAIEPGAYVKTDAAGDVITHVTGTDAEVKIVGKYLGKEGDSLSLAAADGDKIRIKLGMG